MAFEKQMRNLYGYDIWMDWEKPRLGTTIAVFEGPDNVQILYWTDPSELTKEEALAETKALYPDREVVFHDKIDDHQAMVPRIVKEGGGVVEVPAPNSDRSYGRRELVVIGGNPADKLAKATNIAIREFDTHVSNVQNERLVPHIVVG